MSSTEYELNKYQKAHQRGEFDVYKLIEQDNGEPLPPLALQWKEDYKRRFVNVKNTSSR